LPAVILKPVLINMPRRLTYGIGAILFIVSLALIVWQVSFAGSFESFATGDPDQTVVFYGISILIFLLFVWLGFMLVRLLWKLWIERASNRPGSRIKTKLVAGALLLSAMPVFFMVMFSFSVLNNSIRKWFTLPAEHEVVDFDRIARELDRQSRDQANTKAELLATVPQTRNTITGQNVRPGWLTEFCREHGILAAAIWGRNSQTPLAISGQFPRPGASAIAAASAVGDIGSVRIAMSLPLDMVKQEKAIAGYHRAFGQLSSQQKSIRRNYLYLLSLLALFILFVATWLAHYLARQISGPISAVLGAVDEVSKGNLAHRVNVNAVDEMAQLVSGFNRMTGDLDANRREIDARRRFTEAILESIPTGVISVDATGGIQLVNRALAEIFPDVQPRHALVLEDLFTREDAAEIRYLMNRARRTGIASQQLEVRTPRKTLHLAVTVSAIERGKGAGFVIVIEDTSDLLLAQKTAAWSEVARRVAHEIKNPLTPIALSAERVLRQIEKQRIELPPAMDRVVRESVATILDNTASVKRLVDEFSQFSRLPAAQPVLCDLNEVVTSGLGVFAGRLDGIEVRIDLAAALPQVCIDPQQFKQVAVNLIDNAAEAMQESSTRVLTVMTRRLEETVELVFGDTGCGITAEQKEKLFLPYFSTKGRGTGLGLAIVSHILSEHGASIRVDDNDPAGAWFTVEVPVPAAVVTAEVSPAPVAVSL
jgi:two-component system, NtrC family, nitrogen regulation sensor histidine kinase NtrY